MPAQQTSRGEETRAALVAAGRALFARKGYDGTSVRALTTQAGTNLGAVTYHFGSKRDLYTAVLEEGLSPMVLRVEKVSRLDLPPDERILRVVDEIFDFLGENPDVPRLMLQELAAGKQPPDVAKDIIRRHMTNIVSVLEEGMADGSFRRAHPVFSTLSIVSQPIYLTLVSPMILGVAGLDLRDAEVRRAAMEHVKAFVHAGLAAREESNP